MGSRGPLTGQGGRPSRTPVLPGVAAALYSPVSEPPRAPRGLGRAGKAVWRECWKSAAGWLSEGDRAAVAELAKLEDDLDLYRRTIEADGPVLEEIIQSSRGDVIGTRKVAHPLIRELRAAEAVALSLRESLGMNPRSRARIGLTVTEMRVRTESLRASLAAARRKSAQ